MTNKEKVFTINIYQEVINLKQISYVIGKSSYTKKIDIEDSENIEIMNKQLSLSIPLITGAKIENKRETKKIFVGKEINLQSITTKNYWLEKYELSLDELMEIALQGFKRACLLNYKKYEQIIVGVGEEDIIVPDYFALKKLIVDEKNCLKEKKKNEN